MRRRWWICVTVGLGMACGADEPGSLPGSLPEAAPAAAEATPAPGDPLLTKAREGISKGRLEAEVDAQLRGSTAPAHARARRVLLAMAEPPVEPDAEPPPSSDASLRPPPIVPEGDATPAPVMAGKPGTSGRSSTSKVDAPAGPHSSGRPAPSARAQVRTLAMRPSKRGATLTLGAPSSLVVGVANQPQSGIVRLIIEKAKAGGSVLTTRPTMEGAAVTAVRQGKDTVQITLRLDPGWTFGSVKSFSGGARVHLISPR